MMFGNVLRRNKNEQKNEWRSSFQNRKSFWEQKTTPDDIDESKVWITYFFWLKRIEIIDQSVF